MIIWLEMMEAMLRYERIRYDTGFFITGKVFGRLWRLLAVSRLLRYDKGYWNGGIASAGIKT